ncbi:hypothetical protein B0T24DRAFT_32193 [Lasiosphaeria ovina]|uniref:Uncharacterized protein n=1 Tax=Lasiosphaeria ovina TaxID=92902 RepID=A0AAE0NK36_9PEZI|nr:hypothetical protein B0T24DRAFT_32193 [Lasiosphaeria ovina]
MSTASPPSPSPPPPSSRLLFEEAKRKLYLLTSPCLMPSACSLARTRRHAARSLGPAAVLAPRPPPTTACSTNPMTRLPPSSVKWPRNAGAMCRPSTHWYAAVSASNSGICQGNSANLTTTGTSKSTGCVARMTFCLKRPIRVSSRWSMRVGCQMVSTAGRMLRGSREKTASCPVVGSRDTWSWFQSPGGKGGSRGISTGANVRLPAGSTPPWGRRSRT